MWSWSTTSGAVLGSGYCIGYFSVAVMKYSDESNLREKGLILAYYFTGDRVYHGEETVGMWTGS